ncbi:hypothetical protein [Arthrobacter sp. Soil764]|uniref:hypothetical protein n=1 Tax=Arthrobacter sp. Soil764 TaxID=1736403 RepID=UPI0012E36BC6|nr:hypothetical protein [Arthrobacter sp. Soil764]
MTWFLLAVLLVAAASYSQGSRYTLMAGQDPVQAGAAYASATHSPDDFPQHHACCQRYPASRSEPAPLRAAVPDPPAVALSAGTHPALANGHPDTQPRRQALTLDQLSISRT